MLNIYTNENKMKELLNIINIISKITYEKNKKVYTKNTINDFKNIIDKNNLDDIINFILNKNINVNALMSFNYRDLNLYSSNKNFDIKELADYKLFKKELKKLLEDKNYLISFLEKSYKNASKRKGTLFSKLMKYICLIKNSELKNKTIFNNLEIIFNYQELKGIDNFIYIPEQDYLIEKYFKDNNIKLNFRKGRDILIKYNKIYYIGEVKSIGESGGSQNNQFNDIKTCIKEFSTENIVGFGIIYGPCLITKNPYIIEIENNNKIIPITEFIFNLENVLLKSN
jgi:hypothetical protein